MFQGLQDAAICAKTVQYFAFVQVSNCAESPAQLSPLSGRQRFHFFYDLRGRH